MELKIIEDDLVPVYKTDSGEKVVYGTELYSALEINSRFNDWIKNRLEDCEATENEDYQIFTKNLVKGRPQKEYIIKLDTAKEMAMLERNDKGKQVRRYFIAVEKKYKTGHVPQTPSGQIHLLAQGYVELEQKVDEVEKQMDELKNDMPLFGVESDEISNHVKRRGVELLGGKRSEAYCDSGIRKKVYMDIYNQLKREYGLYDDEGRPRSYKALKRKNQADAHDFIDCYTLPTYLQEQIYNCNAQISMEDL